jgi:acyl-CoA synthetase (AMP-forming)/AMP-acid ligase II
VARSDIGSLARGRGVHLGELPQVLAARYGQRNAVEDPAPTPGLDHAAVRTFEDIEEAAARLAAAHARAGRRRGERVLVLLDNRLDIVLHVLALSRLGAVPVPVNHRLTPPEVRAVTEATAAAAAVVDAELGELVGEELDVVTVEELAETLRAHPADRREPDHHLDPDALAVLMTTSGTTGVPKAAALTSRGLLSSLGRLVLAPVGQERGPRRGRDQALAVLPLTHVMGLSVLLGTLCAGIPLIRRGRFDAEEVLDLIEQRRPNVVIAVPTMYADLERAGAAERDLTSVQLWGSSADVLPQDRARRFQRYGAATRLRGRGIGSALFVDIYGMVELSGAAAIRIFPPSLVAPLPAPSFAVRLPGMQVRAVDEDGRPRRPGRVGELQFRGSGVLRGYEGRDDVGPDDEGWFATGDQGRVWPGGVFQFAGRAKDRLKVGGFSVFPAEVEHELRAATHIADVAVVGVADDRLGERPVAVVVPEPGFDAEAFLEWSKQAVAGYRRPTDVVEIEALPRGPNGKVDRAAATEQATKHLEERS